MVNLQTAFRGCVWLLMFGCIARSTSGSEQGYANQWKVPPLRPAAFGDIPTKSTQKVIHVGYPKTGTVSLEKVMDTFGLTYLHGNLGYVPEGWHKESMTSMEEVLASVDVWMEMLGRFELEKLLALYPKAKYILTTRDPDAWYRSATRFFKGIMTEEYFLKHFGSTNFSDAETWKNSFLAHIEKVKQTIPAENLLVIDLTSGNSTENLQKLCQFVEVLIERSDVYEDELTPASEIWFGVEDVFGNVTGVNGWTLESTEKLDDAESRLRRLATTATYGLTFKLRYIGSKPVPTVGQMASIVSQNLAEEINTEVAGGNWSVTSESFMAFEATQNDSITDVAYWGSTPVWSSIVSAETSTTKDPYEYSKSCRHLSSPTAALATSLFGAAVARVMLRCV